MKTRNRRVKLPPKDPTLSPEMLSSPPVSPALIDLAQRSQPPPMLLRIPEVARELGVSERTIQSYLDQGLLERVRIGSRTVRVSRQSLMKLMGAPAE